MSIQLLLSNKYITSLNVYKGAIYRQMDHLLKNEDMNNKHNNNIHTIYGIL